VANCTPFGHHLTPLDLRRAGEIVVFPGLSLRPICTFPLLLCRSLHSLTAPFFLVPGRLSELPCADCGLACPPLTTAPRLCLGNYRSPPEWFHWPPTCPRSQKTTPFWIDVLFRACRTFADSSPFPVLSKRSPPSDSNSHLRI